MITSKVNSTSSIPYVQFSLAEVPVSQNAGTAAAQVLAAAARPIASRGRKAPRHIRLRMSGFELHASGENAVDSRRGGRALTQMLKEKLHYYTRPDENKQRGTSGGLESKWGTLLALSNRSSARHLGTTVMKADPPLLGK